MPPDHECRPFVKPLHPDIPPPPRLQARRQSGLPAQKAICHQKDRDFAGKIAVEFMKGATQCKLQKEA